MIIWDDVVVSYMVVSPGSVFDTVGMRVANLPMIDNGVHHRSSLGLLLSLVFLEVYGESVWLEGCESAGSCGVYFSADKDGWERVKLLLSGFEGSNWYFMASDLFCEELVHKAGELWRFEALKFSFIKVKIMREELETEIAAMCEKMRVGEIGVLCFNDGGFLSDGVEFPVF